MTGQADSMAAPGGGERRSCGVATPRPQHKTGERVELHTDSCGRPETHNVIGGFVLAVREDRSPKHPGVVALVYTLKLDDGSVVEYGPDGDLTPGSCPNAPAVQEAAA